MTGKTVVIITSFGTFMGSILDETGTLFYEPSLIFGQKPIRELTKTGVQLIDDTSLTIDYSHTVWTSYEYRVYRLRNQASELVRRYAIAYFSAVGWSYRERH